MQYICFVKYISNWCLRTGVTCLYVMALKTITENIKQDQRRRGMYKRSLSCFTFVNTVETEQVPLHREKCYMLCLMILDMLHDKNWRMEENLQIDHTFYCFKEYSVYCCKVVTGTVKRAWSYSGWMFLISIMSRLALGLICWAAVYISGVKTLLIYR